MSRHPAGLERVTDIRQLIAKNNTAVISSTLADASILFFSVNRTSVRFSMGGTPTANTGILLTYDQGPFTFEGYNGGSTNYLFPIGATAQVSISGFKRAASGSKS